MVKASAEVSGFCEQSRRFDLAGRAIEDEHGFGVALGDGRSATANMASTSASTDGHGQHLLDAHAQGLGDARERTERRVRVPGLDGEQFVLGDVHPRRHRGHRQALGLTQPTDSGAHGCA